MYVREALISRIWQLRDNLTGYAAAYVAFAEVLASPLLAGDPKLANVTGPRCTVELVR